MWMERAIGWFGTILDATSVMTLLSFDFSHEEFLTTPMGKNLFLYAFLVDA
jgi:hypothetical protein